MSKGGHDMKMTAVKRLGSIFMLGLLVVGLTFTTASVAEALVLQGPVDSPPGGSTMTHTGEGLPDDNLVGITGGRTYTYSDVALADTGIVYWGPVDGGFKLSLDGPDFTGDEMNPRSLNQCADWVVRTKSLSMALAFAVFSM